VSAFNETARGCLTSVAQFEAIEKDEKPLQAQRFLKIDPSKTEPWKGIMIPQLARSGSCRRAGVHRSGNRRYNSGSAGHKAG
jgi:hypothetical protein